jgi:hypothetical protein
MSVLRIAALAILGLAAFSGSPAAAQTHRVYPWCTQDNTVFGTMSCLYSTEAQCRASASGNGQSCVQNPEYWWKIWYPNGKGNGRR